MLEIYFLCFRVPRMMGRLARERNRSAVAWSLIAIGAWLAAEVGVMFGVGLLYGLGSLLLGSSPDLPAGFQFLAYLISLAGAFVSLAIVRRVLNGLSAEKLEPLPPPPPPAF
jgi:hypothetical protein